jgi:hypothetical protein
MLLFPIQWEFKCNTSEGLGACYTWNLNEYEMRHSYIHLMQWQLGNWCVMPCRACEALKNCLPDFLQNGTFNNCLRVNFWVWLVYVFESLHSGNFKCLRSFCYSSNSLNFPFCFPVFLRVFWGLCPGHCHIVRSEVSIILVSGHLSVLSRLTWIEGMEKFSVFMEILVIDNPVELSSGQALHLRYWAFC